MRIRINTIMAHPVYGTAEPGTMLDIPEADAKVLIEAGAAEPVTPHAVAPIPPPYRETAMIDAPGEHEMLPAGRGRSTR